MRAIVATFVRSHLLAIMIVVSTLAHAAVVLALGRTDFQPPVLIPPQVGRASVHVRLSVAADPVPARVVPMEEVRPIPVIDTTELVDRVVPLVVPEEPAPVVLAPTPLPPSIVRAEVPPKREETPPKQQQRERSDVSSAPSQAAEGARPDQLPLDVVTNPAPPYPADALAARLSGTVWLRVRIDATGRVSAISLHESSRVASLDESALRTVQRWVFHPARRNGVPVPYEFLKPIEFSIRQP